MTLSAFPRNRGRRRRSCHSRPSEKHFDWQVVAAHGPYAASAADLRFSEPVHSQADGRRSQSESRPAEKLLAATTEPKIVGDRAWSLRVPCETLSRAGELSRPICASHLGVPTTAGQGPIMEYRELGLSGLHVPALSFGTGTCLLRHHRRAERGAAEAESRRGRLVADPRPVGRARSRKRRPAALSAHALSPTRGLCPPQPATGLNPPITWRSAGILEPAGPRVVFSHAMAERVDRIS